MVKSVLGTKIGMTQVFDNKGVVVPVTVIDINNWFVTQVKTVQKDGYHAVQMGLLRKRFRNQSFSENWLKAKNDYFLNMQEIKFEDAEAIFVPGGRIGLQSVAIQEGDKVAVIGISRGLGFQGVVKRWGFSGGPKAHGSRFHRIPGSGGCMRSQGEVIKGKKFPGHMGCDQVTVKGLRIIRIDHERGYVFVKGAVPGKAGSVVTIKK